jgi:hypoxanthine phosphoribosyltransferase
MANSQKYTIDVLISEVELDGIVDSLAQQIKQDFDDEEIVLVGVLDGAFVFMYELTRALQKLGMQNMIIDFMGMDTYGESTESSQDPKITKDLKHDIRDKNVILVEDIVDTGFSLSILRAMLLARQPKRLATVAMLSKDERREIQVPVEYIGKHIPNKFVIGYGLDYEGKYHRELPYIGTVRFE